MKGFARLLLLVLLPLSSACASMRSVSVGSEDANYSIDVTNQMPHPMSVFWSDGREPRSLGTVGANRTERYIIAAPRTTSITITARGTTASHTAGPYTVNLVSGSTQRVVIR